MTAREVLLEGGLPWGFRMHGGVDVGQPLRIYRVNPGSKAAQTGIREGDLISTINGQGTKNLTNAEAHSLLKNSGDTLKLGLNEDTESSPRKRQYKTILQETHEETVKKSSFSTYSIEKTIETERKNTNDYSASKSKDNYANFNGKTKSSRVNGVESQKSTPSTSTVSTPSTLVGEATTIRNISSDKATIASPGSSYSNCTTLSNQSSIADEGTDKHQDPGEGIMNECSNSNNSSKSKKRRQRKKILKNGVGQKFSCDNIVEITQDTSIENKNITKTNINYKVESPCELKNISDKSHSKVTDAESKKLKVKSKSLDDDDLIKIQEVSEASETEDKQEHHQTIIVSEASESEEDILDQDPLLSPSMTTEEENTLRNFLHGLNLVDSPEDAAKEIYEINTDTSDLKKKKAQKRKELEQYFFPYCQNPRFLDAISEEASDISDKECQLQIEVRHLKHTTPELEITQKKPVVPPRTRKSHRNQNQEVPPIILVDTQIIEPPPDVSSAEGICQTVIVDEPHLNVETVYLNDSSSTTSVDLQESRKSSLTSEEENDYDKNTLSNSTNSSVTPVRDRSLSTERDHLEGTELNTDPQTKESQSKDQEDSSEMENRKENFTETTLQDSSNNDLGHTTTTVSSKFTSTTRISSTNEDSKVLDNCILSQLTPPPTPDNVTPKNEMVDSKITLNPQKQLETEGHQKESLNKEVESLTEKLSACPPYSNVLSPICPSSISSGESSSREGSQCTAKYNLSSSIGDVSTLVKEEELIKSLHQPLTLREIVLKILISLPFGADVLQELAEVSKTIESYTNQLPSKYLPKITHAFMSKSSNPNNDNNESFVDLSVPHSFEKPSKMPSLNEKDREKWCGLPVDENPSVLVCLSPTQKEELEKTRKVPNEAQKLLELHEKFIHRKSSHEELVSKQLEERVTISSISKSSGNIIATTPASNKRCLTIIKEDEPLSTVINNKSKREETNKYLYFDALDTPNDVSKSRLKAKNLDEWLQLARHKSMSESNLDSINIPMNDLGAVAGKFTANNLSKRRSSMPQEMYEKQLLYIMEKEREIQKELEMIQDEKQKLQSEVASTSRTFNAEDFHVSKRGDYAEHKTKARPTSMPVIPTEIFRQQMYNEYVDKFSELQDRKQHKIIKISASHDLDNSNKESKDTIKPKEILHPVMLEDEFMKKVREKKLGQDEVTENREENADEKSILDEKNAEEEPVLVIDGNKLTMGEEALPKHLQEFVDITKHIEEYDFDGIWSPGQKQITESPRNREPPRPILKNKDEPIPPVWTPRSANSSPVLERKEFRPVNFQSPVLSRRSRTKSESIGTPDSTSSEPPWRSPESVPDVRLTLTSTLDRRLPTSQSSPGFPTNFSTTPRLPRAQNPTITLLQKAREGQLPRGAHYIETDNLDRKLPNDRPLIKYPGENLHQFRNEYTSESDSERPRRMADMAPRKFTGIGPTTKDGMPLVLRSEIKEKDQSKWYKRMYDTIHKQRPHKDEYVTIRYKQKRAQYPYSSGYLSEPEPGAYDSDFTDYRYSTLDRRREPYVQQYTTSTMPRYVPEKSYSSSEIVRNTQESHKSQPGKIENYRPGHSSISDKEAKQHLEQQKNVPSHPRSFINQALKESGYESDSTLVFRRREEAASQLSPKEQKEAYKVIQKGGDVPFQGLRKPAPERPKETDLVEFFPISPTLTRIRIHKSITPQKEYFCYPATVHHPNVPKTFASLKRTAPSSISIPPPPPIPPPSPPRRRSSRNNSTLRLISTMKVQKEKSPLCKRHETCFTSGSSIDKTKVNFLKDKITCRLSPSPRRSDSSKLSVMKKITANPDFKSKITSTVTTSRDPRNAIRRVQSSTKVSSPKLQDKMRSKSTESFRSSTSTLNKKSSTESLTSKASTSSIKTFATEKRKFDFSTPKYTETRSKISRTSDLLSPTEVKKITKNPIYKKSSALLSSAKNGASTLPLVLPIKVGFTEKGKSLLKSSISPKLTKRSTVISPCPSTSSEKSKQLKSSLESLGSVKSSKKVTSKLSGSNSKRKDDKKSLKSKKEQLNERILMKTKKAKSAKNSPSSAKETTDTSLEDIKKQKDAIQSNHFFRNLFLRNVTIPENYRPTKKSWLAEKTIQLSTRRRPSISEPSIGAMKVYLKHTKPVTDSKFVSLDMVRSRSTSPKSVTFSDNIGTEYKTSKRSTSLPSKLIFTETSRPVSPVVTKKQRSPPRSPILKSRHNLVTIRRSTSPPTKLFFSETSRPISPEVKRKLRSPPPSPSLMRSPSCRRIMQFKQSQVVPSQEVALYASELNQSTTSLDSLKSDDYHTYVKDVTSSRRSDRFKDLNHFYNSIEKVGYLEKKVDLKPRKKSENEIIDYDRWMEVRVRERAEEELKSLYNCLKRNQKEKGFLFLPKDVSRIKWKKELDRGLRIKERSVDNIKEEFEKLKKHESDLENARRREIDYCKDTYKPLWRGNSVVNLASILTERRSQSEPRVRTAKQKLLDSEKMLTHGIGSRIWSSLSMEQVNLLKEQLAEIYGETNRPKQQPVPVKPPAPTNYFIEVPPEDKERQDSFPTALTVRRNSESSKHSFSVAPSRGFISEDDKKQISHTLSKEVLEKIARKRKENKLALPVMVGKETLGAIAAKEANVKAKTEEPSRALVKINALSPTQNRIQSETESGSTDESTKTVLENVTSKEDIKKKVEYFEKAREIETFTPTVYKAADESVEETPQLSPKDRTQSQSCQNLKEYYGESELVKFATIPLSATKKSEYKYSTKPLLRSIDGISPIRTISEANSFDSLFRSRSTSPHFEETQSLLKKGEVGRLKRQFEIFEDSYGERKLRKSRSDSDLKSLKIGLPGNVDDLRRKYEYPIYSGRGRSRIRRGGVVSPIFLRAEDRYMPHINIISKIASLYCSKKRKNDEISRSMEELAEILGCPVGEVEKLKEKFDKMKEDISLVGHMYTSSPSIRELRDVAPYLAANWTAHRYPKSEDNTRSLSSPETSVASRDTSLVKRSKNRAKSSSPSRPTSPKKQSESQPILKQKESNKSKYEPVGRYTPEPVRYKKEPEIPPPPPPKSLKSQRSLEPESPRKYVENEVTIHYKTPVRQEIKEYVSEDELAHRQAEAMKKIYQEERRRKYLQVSKSLQELQDMNSRRHTDNFIPSQKSPISLNRYDDFDDLAPSNKTRTRSPEPRLVARALYNFVGQTARELTFRKGDLIYVRRQIDKNWYEGELNAMIGLFPTNYVEIVPYEGVKIPTPRKSHEGQARAKYNFLAQTHLELSLAKGELVTITRKVDDNWYEGKIGGRKGIFPLSYVDVLIDPQAPPPSSNKPVAAPAAHSLLLNGSAQGKESMGSHLYTPSLPNPDLTTSYRAKPVQITDTNSYNNFLGKSLKNPVDQALHIETQSEPIPYRALYKYNPQNDDELELLEGDTVYVLEKCDDGWFVGSSDRTGAFGTFPGNYVEKI